MAITSKDVIANWIRALYELRLSQGKPPVFTTHELENHIVDFGIRRYGIAHTPGTYSRKFREMKEPYESYRYNSEYNRMMGSEMEEVYKIYLTDVSNSVKKNENAWEVKLITKPVPKDRRPDKPQKEEPKEPEEPGLF
jgi:hypothetical protein